MTKFCMERASFHPSSPYDSVVAPGFFVKICLLLALSIMVVVDDEDYYYYYYYFLFLFLFFFLFTSE